MHYKLYAMMEVFFHLDRFFGGVSCNARIYHAENHCDMGKYEESGEKSDANGFFASRCFWNVGRLLLKRCGMDARDSWNSGIDWNWSDCADSDWLSSDDFVYGGRHIILYVTYSQPAINLLFRAADLALYDVKSNGRNSCKVFVPSMIS